jgi:hypothetical protein
MESSPFHLARALWSSEALDLTPPEFQSRFDAIYERATDIDALWQLGGAVNDYLRRRPESVAAPPDLPLVLLASKHVPARIVGLKLLNRLNAPPSQLIPHISAALQSSAEDEIYGGLFELGELLRRSPSTTRGRWNDLKKQLQDLCGSPDPYVRSTSERYLDWLQDVDL